MLKSIRLNPCSNGILKYFTDMPAKTAHVGLNPCSNGILKYCPLGGEPVGAYRAS